MEYAEKQSSLKNQLDQMPEKKQKLITLFSTSLQKAQSQIIALRVYDINTFLQQYIHGNLPIDTTYNLESPRNPDEEGLFFTQAVTSNSALQHAKAFPPSAATFSKEVYTITEGQRAVPLQSAFIQNVTPFLKQNWLELITPVVKDYDLVETDQIVLQHFVLGLAQRFEEADKRKIPTNNLIKTAYKDPYSKVLMDTFEDQTQLPSVIELFRNACRERAGIVVGFNTNLLAYPYITEHNGGSSLAAQGELLIKPPDGTINLSCISAIETLGGSYEEEILQTLGISN